MYEVVVITEQEMKYLEAFRHLSDNVVLAVSGQELFMAEPTACLCGWALRATLAEARKRSLEEVTETTIDELLEHTGEDVPTLLANKVGGDEGVWTNIFTGVARADSLPSIERAWTVRVDEALAASEELANV